MSFSISDATTATVHRDEMLSNFTTNVPASAQTTLGETSTQTLSPPLLSASCAAARGGINMEILNRADIQFLLTFVPPEIQRQGISGTKTQSIQGECFTIISYNELTLTLDNDRSTHVNDQPVLEPFGKKLEFEPKNCNICIWSQNGTLQMLAHDELDNPHRMPPVLMLLSENQGKFVASRCYPSKPMPFPPRPIEGRIHDGEEEDDDVVIFENLAGDCVTFNDNQLLVNGHKMYLPGDSTNPFLSQKFRCERDNNLIVITNENNIGVLYRYYVDLNYCINGNSYQLVQYKLREITQDEATAQLRRLQTEFPDTKLHALIYNIHGIAVLCRPPYSDKDLVFWANPEQIKTKQMPLDIAQTGSQVNGATRDGKFSFLCDESRDYYELNGLPAHRLKI